MTSNNAFEILNDKIIESLDKHLPVQKININKLKPSRPWLTISLHKCITKSKRLYSKTLQKHCPETDHLKYKNYRNVLNKLKRKAMQLYFTDKCLEFKQNGKKLWQIIRKVTQTCNDKSTVINCLKINDIKCYENKAIANEFGQYFAYLGRKYHNKIPQAKKEITEYLRAIDPEKNSIYFDPTTELEIDKIISNLQSKNSHGHDGLTNKLIKDLKPALIKPLGFLFNLSLATGNFPEIYKKSDVVPLYKSKCRELVSNYRPISLLPVLSKILEKIVYK